MAVPPLCVRVSLFQAMTATREDHADGEGGKHDVAVRLLRSRMGDYRGDVLIPLHSLTSSTAANMVADDVNVKNEPATAQLITALEQRLSKYCVLHVPKAHVKAFVKENRVSDGALVPYSTYGGCDMSSSAAASDGEDAAQPERLNSTRFCTDCSASLAKEAAPASASASDEKAPWINICQLQRMSGVPGISTGTLLTAEDWMLRQQGPTDLFVSASEAEDLQIEVLSDNSVIAGGACFAAFFQLRMVSLDERGQRLAALHSVVDVTSPGVPPASQPFFTVKASNNIVRIGAPPSLPASSAEERSEQTTSSLPSLERVVWRRLYARRGVKVRRLLDLQTGAAVLPCESASALIAASLTTLVAECDETTEAHQHEGPTQLLPGRSYSFGASAIQTQELSQGVNGSSLQSTSDLFDHLVGLRAQHRADQYYYDGFQANDWTDQRTAISLSEFPSEPELRMTSVGSQASDFTAIYPNSSLSRRPSLASRTTVSVFTVSGENSRSCPAPAVCGEGEALSNNGAAPGLAEEEGNKKKYCSAGASAEGFVAAVTAHNADATARRPGSPVGDTASSFIVSESPAIALRDSLRDMNEVFVYEDEETVKELQDVGASSTELNAQTTFVGTQQRRSSLVWSTPVARGSAGGFNFAESGVSATPLTYRTSTQLSASPSTSPFAVCAGGMAPETASGQLVQRRIFSPSPSSHTSSTPTQASGDEGSQGEAVLDDVSTGGASHDVENSASSETMEQSSVTVADDDVEDDQVAADTTSSALPQACFSKVGDASVSLASSSPPRSHRSRSSGDQQQETDANVTHAATPIRQQVRTPSSTHHFACTPPFHSNSVALPSSPPSQSMNTAQHHPLHSPFAVLEEGTTPLPSHSTPPSQSRAAEQELRSHLQGWNSLVTQKTPMKSAGMDEVGSEDRHPHEGYAFVRTAVAMPFSSSWGRGTTKRPREGQEDCIVGTPQSPTPRAEAVSSQHSPPGLLRRSAPTSAIRINSTDSSLPSTVAAGRQARHRSPIYFSPEELVGMVAEPAADSADTKMTRFASTSPSSRGDSTSDGEAIDEGRRGTPLDRLYGPFVASYNLRESDHANSAGGVAGWGYGLGAFNSHSSPQTSPKQQQQRHSTPQRPPVASSVGFPGGMGPIATPSFVFAEAGSVTEQPLQRSLEQQLSSASYSAGALHVTSHRLRRSESHSASGMETWVRFSDIEGDEASRSFAGGVGGRASTDNGDEDGLMLVTQQEIPYYTAQLSSSGTDEEVDQGNEEVSEGHVSTGSD
ncbi:hypothetical protein ABL78_4783 [Leptomonas seymouri]|uniref:Uncharacterized protein n=1 Tax=Leptomonas seymouri TaxID=5684 RepID=A0A0N1HXR1_LEPSE|nr:hypothetical protein ABL78_4783 [Leptomonas seymouri]|eukprot:KPI86161.1 hypothetical protein ABL78_4783 [Leptomonas seymouri]